MLILPVSAQDTIKYGLGVALTGPIGFMGTQYSYVNDGDGIDGKKLELVIRDTKGVPAEALAVTAFSHSAIFFLMPRGREV